MSVVPLPPGVPGIRALLTAFPETARPLLELAQAVLRGPSSLSEAERELLAVAVSAANGCAYCTRSHGAAARVLWGVRAAWVDAVIAGGLPPDDKLASLVSLARELAASVHGASPEAVARARDAGASDRDLHDTVLVAAAFSLYNRYVDGLGAPEPADAQAYAAIGERLARSGYR